VRITVDANVLVRANTRATGPAREVLNVLRLEHSHRLILSRHILAEIQRTLLYPRLQALYALTEAEIREHVELLRQVSTIVEPAIADPVIRVDPEDDFVLYTAVEGRAEVLCTRDRHFYAPEVIAFCSQRGIKVMNEVDLLRILQPVRH